MAAAERLRRARVAVLVGIEYLSIVHRYAVMPPGENDFAEERARAEGFPSARGLVDAPWDGFRRARGFHGSARGDRHSNSHDPRDKIR